MKNIRIALCGAIIAASSSLHAHKEMVSSFLHAYPVAVPAAVVGIGLVTERFVVREAIQDKTRHVGRSFTKHPVTTTVIGALAVYITGKMLPKIAKHLIKEPFKKNPFLTAGICAAFCAAPTVLELLKTKPQTQKQTN